MSHLPIQTLHTYIEGINNFIWSTFGTGNRMSFLSAWFLICPGFLPVCSQYTDGMLHKAFNRRPETLLSLNNTE